MEIGTATDVGRVREHNEDSLLVKSRPDRPEWGTLCLVADGMGGHAAGEVASRLAVETAAERYFASAGSARSALVEAVRQANIAVWQAGQAQPGYRGMGTTLVAAAVLDGSAVIANVGDSRAYTVNARAITQVTADHSWVAEQVRLGLLTPQAAETHPYRAVLTRALGTAPDVEVDSFEVSLAPGEAIVLCSDGLTAHVRDEEIQAIVAASPPPEAASKLVALANARGGTDNITVIVVRV